MTLFEGHNADRAEDSIPQEVGGEQTLHEEQAVDEAVVRERRERMRKAASHLLFIGVPQGRVTQLLGVYDIERIERQLEWITSRRARYPSKLIVAAIEQDYPMPLSIQARHVAVEALNPRGDEP